jgi:hypothetical protein
MAPLHIRRATSSLRREIKRQHIPREITRVRARRSAAYPLSPRSEDEMKTEQGARLMTPFAVALQ